MALRAACWTGVTEKSGLGESVAAPWVVGVLGSWGFPVRRLFAMRCGLGFATAAVRGGGVVPSVRVGNGMHGLVAGPFPGVARCALHPELSHCGLSERVLKISQAVLRRGGASGVVAPQLQISNEYAPSSRLAIRPAALAIPCRPIFKTRSQPWGLYGGQVGETGTPPSPRRGKYAPR